MTDAEWTLISPHLPEQQWPGEGENTFDGLQKLAPA
jgi:hypothetical protein